MRGLRELAGQILADTLDPGKIELFVSTFNGLVRALADPLETLGSSFNSRDTENEAYPAFIYRYHV
ncbi:hypothetical protein [Streptomyces sp. 8N706]|uniref:hypothetical protein n=1 Tax=Streptomyces sp. 8N706 TaxID=3457416 RepID=UPI003FD2955B